MSERPFSDFLPTIRAGRTDSELADALRDLTRQCLETQKAGSLTLTIKLKPNGGSGLFVDAKLVAKAPEATQESTLFYATEDGDLTRRDPRQPTLSGLIDPEERDR